MNKKIFILPLVGLLVTSILTGYATFYSTSEKTTEGSSEPLWYEISGLNGSSPYLKRSTNNTNHLYPSDGTIFSNTNPTSYGLCYEINNYFFKSEEVTDTNGNVFIKIKKFYIKIIQNSDNTTAIRVSHFKIDDDYLLNPYFLDEDGTTELDYCYYGKYKGSVSNNKIWSKSGVNAVSGASNSAKDYRNFLTNWNNSSYFLTDWCAMLTGQIIFMFVWGTTDAETAWNGYASDNNHIRGAGSRTGSGKALIGIEDFLGNGLEFVDGIIIKYNTAANYGLMYSKNISSYYQIYNFLVNNDQSAFTNFDGKPITVYGGDIGNHSQSYVKKLYNSTTLTPFLLYPSEIGGSSSTYYCDIINFNSSKKTAHVSYWGCTGNDSSKYHGLFYTENGFLMSETCSGLSTRLHAKKITLKS